MTKKTCIRSVAKLLVVCVIFELAIGLWCGRICAAEDPFVQPSVAFKGEIALTAKDSVPDWPKPLAAPAGAPNILLILIDDIGFADTDLFGGIARTPELDKLSAQGLRYNNLNNAARCSPTRAALLTGRNHHRVGFGSIADEGGGYPGYNAVWKKSTASIAEILRLNGYSTAAFGKWHNTPDWEITPTGPFERWPTGLGFEQFYGFMGPAGDENQWEPTKLYRNTTPVDPPARPEQGYHLTTDLTNEAIRWIRTHETLAAEKPYFLYFATGAVHFPHQTPQEWIDGYKGQFDKGWDKLREEIFARQKTLGVVPVGTTLTPRPKEIPAWDTLSSDQRRLYARQMEVYAGFITHTDHEVGRLLEAVRTGPHAYNTLVIYIVGDNGATAEGGLDGFTSGATTLQGQLRYINSLGSAAVPVNLYSNGWAWMGNTPFQYWKTVASHFGGTRDPMIVSWPARIRDRGGLRTQFTHVNDVAPTIYSVIGITPPSAVNGIEQQPFDGMSFAQTFSDPNAPSEHHTQYFEMLGNRAIYHDGWVAAAKHRVITWWPSDGPVDPLLDRWELYHVTNDFSEAQDISKQFPEKLKELKVLFDREARKNDVYPLLAAGGPGEPSLTAGRRDFTYLPGTRRIPDALIPDLMETSYRMTADVIIPETGAEGVLASYGTRVDGFVWYVQRQHLVFENRSGEQHQTLTSKVSIPSGHVTLEFDFERQKPDKTQSEWWLPSGTGRLYINGSLSAEEFIPRFYQKRDVALFVGRCAGSPVSRSFAQPFAFTGTLSSLHIELEQPVNNGE